MPRKSKASKPLPPSTQKHRDENQVISGWLPLALSVHITELCDGSGNTRSEFVRDAVTALAGVVDQLRAALKTSAVATERIAELDAVIAKHPGQLREAAEAAAAEALEALSETQEQLATVTAQRDEFATKLRQAALDHLLLNERVDADKQSISQLREANRVLREASDQQADRLRYIESDQREVTALVTGVARVIRFAQDPEDQKEELPARFADVANAWARVRPSQRASAQERAAEAILGELVGWQSIVNTYSDQLAARRLAMLEADRATWLSEVAEGTLSRTLKGLPQIPIGFVTETRRLLGAPGVDVPAWERVSVAAQGLSEAVQPLLHALDQDATMFKNMALMRELVTLAGWRPRPDADQPGDPSPTT